MSWVFRCEVCNPSDDHMDVDEVPKWSIMRVGDVVTSWACDEHLHVVCDRLQRDHEVTELVVRNHQKSTEWAGISRQLDEVADEHD